MGGRLFLAAMYLRLSREDKESSLESESNSIKNQRELIRAFIRAQQDIELYDVYVDDGFSGSSFDRPEFKRMISDMEGGRINCVIVKDLSRFGRDYIEAGRYIQKIFPALGVRFIALTDHFDSFHADAGESGIVLPVKNFINDSYCRDISTKVKSQFEVKRRNGEYIAPFPLYGYKKAKDNRNRLVVDEYAAEVVKRIFAWKIEGAAVSAIADKLNDLGILSPKEYKKSTGMNYRGGFSGAATAKWSSAAVKRILTNEMYLGHMVQGKTEKINYKIKKSVKKPKEAWIQVENTQEPIISRDNFEVVQNLLKADARISPVSRRQSPFSGILFCGDCGEQMIRRVNRYKNTQKVYYICSTKNRGEGCSRHSIGQEQLKEIVLEAVRKFANCFLEEKGLYEKAAEMEINFEPMAHCDTEITRLKGEQDKYCFLCFRLHEDLREGILTKDEFERLYREFKRKAKEIGEALKKQELMRRELLQNGVLSAARLKALQDCPKLKEIDRHTLCTMVKRISVFENQRVEIEFYYMDRYRQNGVHRNGQTFKERRLMEEE